MLKTSLAASCQVKPTVLCVSLAEAATALFAVMPAQAGLSCKTSWSLLLVCFKCSARGNTACSGSDGCLLYLLGQTAECRHRVDRSTSEVCGELSTCTHHALSPPMGVHLRCCQAAQKRVLTMGVFQQRCSSLYSSNQAWQKFLQLSMGNTTHPTLDTPQHV